MPASCCLRKFTNIFKTLVFVQLETLSGHAKNWSFSKNSGVSCSKLLFKRTGCKGILWSYPRANNQSFSLSEGCLSILRAIQEHFLKQKITYSRSWMSLKGEWITSFFKPTFLYQPSWDFDKQAKAVLYLGSISPKYSIKILRHKRILRGELDSWKIKVENLGPHSLVW